MSLGSYNPRYDYPRPRNPFLKFLINTINKILAFLNDHTNTSKARLDIFKLSGRLHSPIEFLEMVRNEAYKDEPRLWKRIVAKGLITESTTSSQANLWVFINVLDPKQYNDAMYQMDNLKKFIHVDMYNEETLTRILRPVVAVLRRDSGMYPEVPSLAYKSLLEYNKNK